MRFKLKIFQLSIILTIALSGLTACGQSSDCFDQKVFCAALVTDTLGLHDHGINEEAWAGLEQAKVEGLVDKVDFIESVDTRDYQKNIEYFMEEGYDVIITSGVGLDDRTLQAAILDPAATFIGINQTYNQPVQNLISVTFPEDQMGFVAGFLAARLTKTQIIGGVCETSGIDSMWRYCEGFRAGANYENKSVKVLVFYRDNGDREKLFIDEDWGSQTAQTLLKRGADVVFAAGGVTAQAALRTASAGNVLTVGTERDQKAALGAESGSGVLTSIYGQSRLEVHELMRAIRAGNIPNTRIGQFGYVPLDSKFPENLKTELDLLIKGLLNGEIKTNVPLMKP